jgi:hypothetical protein
MKKQLLTATLIALGGMYVHAQTIVSTTPQKKNAVLEEFTGVKCYYCPDGHKRATNYAKNKPGRVVLINIHEGGYASPSGGYPDYRTSFGSAIATQSGALGYPAGTINRRNFPGYEQRDNDGNLVSGILAQGRTTWATTGDMVLQENSPVNIAVNAIVDMTTRVLTVDVEVYYTSDVKGSYILNQDDDTVYVNKINVALLQNNIEGPQEGAEDNYSTNILPNGKYVHNHVLRRLLTGQWGEEISNTTTGRFFSKQYIYTIPAHLNNVPYDLSNLEIAVFVADNQINILNGVSAEVGYINNPYNYEAALQDAIIPAEVCFPNVTPLVGVKNFGSQDLTSLRFDYFVSEEDTKTYVWFGNVPSFEKIFFSLPQLDFTHKFNNTLKVMISNPNFKTDENIINNSLSSAVIQTVTTNEKLIFTLKTDPYPDEIGWSIKNSKGEEIDGKPIGFYTANLTEYTHEIEIPESDCYELFVYDEYGDGLYGNNTSTRGYFKLEDENGTVVTYNDGSMIYTTYSKPFESLKVISSVEEMSNNNFVSVYPNPFSSNTNIKINLTKSDNVEYTLVNVLGEVILRENKGTLPAGNHLFDLDGNQLSNGFYQLQVKVGNTINSSKLVVNH